MQTTFETPTLPGSTIVIVYVVCVCVVFMPMSAMIVFDTGSVAAAATASRLYDIQPFSCTHVTPNTTYTATECCQRRLLLLSLLRLGERHLPRQLLLFLSLLSWHSCSSAL